MLEYLNSPQSNRAFKILVIVALLVFVATILVFWFGGSSFRESGIEVKLEGPDQALSGDEVTYKLTYSNHTRTDIHNIKFRFVYPDNSIVITGDNQYSSDIAVDIDAEDLGAGQTATKEFKAFLIGDKGSILYARAEMAYEAGGVSSRFEKKPVTVGTTITGMPVPITLSAPPTAVSGQDVTYTLDYRNESAGDISDLRFTFTYPNGFTPRKLTPQATSSGTTWDVATLKRGMGARISITGALTGNEQDNKMVSLVVQHKINGNYIDYERSDASTIISSPLLNVSISVNSTRDYTATPGDYLAYSVAYRNTSSYTFTGLTLEVALDGDMYDYDMLDPGQGYLQISTNTIVWDASSIPAFGSLAPGASGKADFRIKIKPNFMGVVGSRNTLVKATATLSTSVIPTGLDGNSISTTDSLITKISTQPSINQTMYYNDPAYGSSGPIPPTAGTETVFTVHWQIVNPGNAVNGTQVKATLPTGVVWKNVVSSVAGQPQPIYDRTKNLVIWNIGQLPSGAGVSSPKYDTSFQIGITPTTAQRNTVPTLLRDGTLSGTDALTSQNFVVNMGILTTNDSVDQSSHGTVQ